jgi:hypothetical protein
LEVPDYKVPQYRAKEIKPNLRLAIYGFPIGYNEKYKILEFMPLRYVFFDAVTGLTHYNTTAINGFAQFIADRNITAANVLDPQLSITRLGSWGATFYNVPGKTVRVRSYYRRDGTYVRSYTRRAPR